MDEQVPSVPDELGQKLNATASASLDLILRALRGKLDLEDRGNRTLLGVASSSLSTWGRHEQTQTARWALRLRATQEPKQLPDGEQ